MNIRCYCKGYIWLGGHWMVFWEWPDDELNVSTLHVFAYWPVLSALLHSWGCIAPERSLVPTLMSISVEAVGVSDEDQRGAVRRLSK